MDDISILDLFKEGCYVYMRMYVYVSRVFSFMKYAHNNNHRPNTVMFNVKNELAFFLVVT